MRRRFWPSVTLTPVLARGPHTPVTASSVAQGQTQANSQTTNTRRQEGTEVAAVDFRLGQDGPYVPARTVVELVAQAKPQALLMREYTSGRPILRDRCSHRFGSS